MPFITFDNEHDSQATCGAEVRGVAHHYESCVLPFGHEGLHEGLSLTEKAPRKSGMSKEFLRSQVLRPKPDFTLEDDEDQ